MMSTTQSGIKNMRFDMRFDIEVDFEKVYPKKIYSIQIEDKHGDIQFISVCSNKLLTDKELLDKMIKQISFSGQSLNLGCEFNKESKRMKKILKNIKRMSF